jgi:hypothetical protein
MISLEWPPYSKANVWLGKQPTLTPNLVESLRDSVHTIRPDAAIPSRCAIEMWVGKGGRTDYGLLGASLLTGHNNELLIEVSVSQEITDLNLSAVREELTYPGLPHEYAEAVIKEAVRFSATPSLGAGILRFDCGKHGIIGSSEAFFERLTRIVIHLLLQSQRMSSEQDLIALLNAS